MTFSGFSFMFWRLFQIVTLIPTVGMLAWFVNYFTNANLACPVWLLVIFIVSVLALAWAIGTLFLYSRAKHSAGFVAFVDLLFVGAFIGAVYELRWITDANCTSFERYSGQFSALGFTVSSNNFFHLTTNKGCAMLKASFAFGIMNCIFFFITFLLALLVERHYGKEDRVVVRRETHVSRHGHRGHRHSPRHSHHSRRSYV